MADGKPGEHPLTDIIVHKIETYGPDADDYIRGVSDFSSRHELYEWWSNEVKGETDRQTVLKKARDRYHELMMRSQASGWGTQK
jgi:type 1 glutamine amidotransferase